MRNDKAIYRILKLAKRLDCYYIPIGYCASFLFLFPANCGVVLVEKQGKALGHRVCFQQEVGGKRGAYLRWANAFIKDWEWLLKCAIRIPDSPV